MLELSELGPLQKALVERFGLNELKSVICFDLGIDHETLEQPEKNTLVRELILDCRRKERLSELIDLVIQQRPWEAPTLIPIKTKLDSKNPFKKIQLYIVDTTKAILDQVQLVTDIANAYNRQGVPVSVEEISLIATARGSLRLLIEVPRHIADLILSSQKQAKLQQGGTIESVKDYSQISSDDQDTWVWLYSNTTLWPPSISWEMARQRKLTQQLVAQTPIDTTNLAINLKLLAGYLTILGFVLFIGIELLFLPSIAEAIIGSPSVVFVIAIIFFNCFIL